jgi:hypothetical protein
MDTLPFAPDCRCDGLRLALPVHEVKMDRPYTFKEKARIALGAMVALVIVGWIAVIAIAATSVR